MNYYGIDYDDNYLKHYGVLGMRWGIRKARNLRSKASTTGDRTKRNLYLAKANSIENYHKSMAGAKTYKRVKNQSLAKTLGQAATFGSYGAMRYNQARAAGKSRYGAAVRGAAASASNTLSDGLAEFISPRIDRKRGKTKKY